MTNNAWYDVKWFYLTIHFISFFTGGILDCSWWAWMHTFFTYCTISRINISQFISSTYINRTHWWADTCTGHTTDTFILINNDSLTSLNSFRKQFTILNRIGRTNPETETASNTGVLIYLAVRFMFAISHNVNGPVFTCLNTCTTGLT